MFIKSLLCISSERRGFWKWFLQTKLFRFFTAVLAANVLVTLNVFLKIPEVLRRICQRIVLMPPYNRTLTKVPPHGAKDTHVGFLLAGWYRKTVHLSGRIQRSFDRYFKISQNEKDQTAEFMSCVINAEIVRCEMNSPRLFFPFCKVLFLHMYVAE